MKNIFFEYKLAFEVKTQYEWLLLGIVLNIHLKITCSSQTCPCFYSLISEF